jgi:hypothetical protein
VAVCAVMGLSSFDCSPEPSGLGGQGGSSSQGGSTTVVREDAAIANTGGSNGPDAELVNIKLDVIPAWWAEQDAWAPDTPPPPTPDAHCGITEEETTRQPVDVLLVLDRSASMEWALTSDCYCSGGGVGAQTCESTVDCTTPSRWDAVAPAVRTTVGSSDFVQWGLKFFPSPGGGTGVGGGIQCTVNDRMDVPIGPDSAAAIQSQIDAANFSLGTPTTPAIESATAYLQGLSDTNDKVILLATDGEPNCKDGNINNPDVDGASAACAAAKAAGFPVYVIGIGPNLDNLSALAQGGGTDHYYPVTSPEELAEALTAISKIVGSCTYQTDTAPEDPENVAVYVNKELIEKDAADGWKYGATNQEIVLTGSYCQDITDGKETKVQILFGCPGAPPFDPFLP